MKTAIFVHDHIFLRGPDGHVYSEGKLTDRVFDRYKDVANHVIVFSRMRDVTDVKDLVPVLSDHVSFQPCTGLSLACAFTRMLRPNLALIRRLSTDADLAIIRAPSALGLIVGASFWMRGKPYICEVVGSPRDSIQEARPGLRGIVMSLFSDLAHRHLVGKALGAIYVSKTLSKEWPTNGTSAFISNVELVSDSVVMPPQRYEQMSPRLKIGLVGSYRNRHKGIDLAIEACALLETRGIPCALHILGSGESAPLVSHAQAMGAGDVLVFDGIRAAGASVNEWLNSLDVYIQPSRTEGLPRALVEAMAQGLPCVGSNVGGIPDLLTDEFLFPKEDVDAFVQILEGLAKDSNLRAIAGRENSKTSELYSAEILEGRRKKFWEKCSLNMDDADL